MGAQENAVAALALVVALVEVLNRSGAISTNDLQDVLQKAENGLRANTAETHRIAADAILKTIGPAILSKAR